MDERRNAAIRVIEALEEAGYEAYLVGGCVRDYILKKSPQDYDVATSARPEQIQKIFSHTIPTGLQHGTVTVMEKRIPIEVTTFRIESDYIDHRRPGTVEFVSSLKQDLARRDFTFNAMAQDRHGKIYDYFDGIRDLEHRRIRTVGNPLDRFAEDALRMVRAARFAGQFGFQLEPKTEQAMKSLKHECIYLSVERITAEIEKMWGSERASIGLDYLFRTEVIKYIPPFRYWNLQLVPHPNTLKLVDQCKDRIVRWAYLLYICGTGEDQIKSRLIELRLSNADISKITTCFHLGTLWPAPLSKIEAKKLLLKHGLEAVIRAAHLAKLLLKIPFPEQVESFIEGCWAEMPVKSLKELKISGKDLVMQKEWTPGPWVKQTLNYLLEQVALGLIPNEKEILLKKGCQFGTDHS